MTVLDTLSPHTVVEPSCPRCRVPLRAGVAIEQTVTGECKGRHRSIKSRKAWNSRQAGNAVLRLIARYKDLHAGSYPSQIALPEPYLKSLPVKFRKAMFGVRLVVKEQKREAA